MSFFVGVILIAGVVVWTVARPLISGGVTPRGRTGHEPTEAESRRRIALLVLRDVELDYATGKLDAEDYRDLRAEAAAEALAAIQAVDEVVTDNGDDPSDLTTDVSTPAVPGVCDGCGHVLEAESNFCSACGDRVR